MAIRILLIDDHTIFREFAARGLSAEADMEVVGQADSVEMALGLLRGATPDVVLLDYDLHGHSGLEFIPAARKRGFAGCILIVSASIPESDLADALRGGVSGLVLKEEPLERLLAAIRAVMDGRTWLDERHMHVLVSPQPPGTELTFRERHILVGIIHGKSNKEIAEQLGMPETSVKSGLQVLFRKTGVRTRGSLVRVALEKYPHLMPRPAARGNYA